jgi:hypothetical protein
MVLTGDVGKAEGIFWPELDNPWMNALLEASL